MESFKGPLRVSRERIGNSGQAEVPQYKRGDGMEKDTYLIGGVVLQTYPDKTRRTQKALNAEQIAAKEKEAENKIESLISLAAIAHILFPHNIPQVKLTPLKKVEEGVAKYYAVFKRMPEDAVHSEMGQLVTRTRRYYIEHEEYPGYEEDIKRYEQLKKQIQESPSFIAFKQHMAEAGFTGYELSAHNIISAESDGVSTLKFVDFRPACTDLDPRYPTLPRLNFDPEKLHSYILSHLDDEKQDLALRALERVYASLPGDVKKEFDKKLPIFQA